MSPSETTERLISALNGLRWSEVREHAGNLAVGLARGESPPAELARLLSAVAYVASYCQLDSE